MTGWVDPPPPAEITDDEPEWEVETILDHRHVKRGRKNKVEHLIKFLGYNTANDMWQQDMTNCEQLMQGCWDGKVGSERLVVLLKLTSMRMQDSYSGCLSPPLMRHALLRHLPMWTMSVFSTTLAYLPCASGGPHWRLEYVCAVRSAICVCKHGLHVMC